MRHWPWQQNHSKPRHHQTQTLVPADSIWYQNNSFPILENGALHSNYSAVYYKIEKQINNILKSVNLEDFAERFPNELSGGMQQRAAFCQAMIHDPKIILLDEPLGKLDAMTREKIRADFQKLWMVKKPTVIFVTHSIEEAVQLSSRVILISPRPGKIDREIKNEI